jgi:hypothetical protein
VWTEQQEKSSGAELTAQDLSAEVEGAPARVRCVHGPDDDLLLLLVTDLAEDLSLVIPAKEALVSHIEQLSANTYVGLMQAQDGLKVLVDPTADREALAAAIEALPVSGNAGLLDTVETVARIADSILAKSDVRVAVLYVTDSDVRNYREDFINPVINRSDRGDLSRRFPEGLVREKISKLDGVLAALQSPLFVVHLDYRSDRLNDAYQAGLMQLADTTGGTSIFCRSNTEVPDAVARIFETITSHYSVGLQLSERPPKMFEVQLESDGRALNYRPRFLLDGR